MKKARCKQSVFISATVLGLAGCASVSTDPREGGLVGGVVGITGGAYDERTEQREDALETLDRIEDSLNAAIAQDLETASLLERRISIVHTRLLTLRGKLDDFEKINAEREDLSEDVSRLKQNIAQIEFSIEQQQELIALRQKDEDEKSRLERMVEEQEQADAFDAEYEALVEQMAALEAKVAPVEQGT